MKDIYKVLGCRFPGFYSVVHTWPKTTMAVSKPHHYPSLLSKRHALSQLIQDQQQKGKCSPGAGLLCQLSLEEKENQQYSELSKRGEAIPKDHKHILLLNIEIHWNAHGGQKFILPLLPLHKEINTRMLRNHSKRKVHGKESLHYHKLP